MARVKITEYAAKRLLLGDVYTGISCTPADYTARIKNLPEANYVVKVDVGIKKRNQLGLVTLNVTMPELPSAILKYFDGGYERVVIEPMVPHEITEEQYLSFSLTRTGFDMLYSAVGGVDIEKHSALERELFPITYTPDVTNADPVVAFKQTLLAKMKEFHFTFLEINPFLFRHGVSLLLDAAAEIDSNYLNRLPSWVESHVIGNKDQAPAEQAIAALNEISPASFNLKILNPDGAIFTLLSGGGASLVTLDVLTDSGLQSMVGNYGEYSGGPSREETRIYTEEILKLLCASKASRKVLVIAGGVANFTDVATTFAGIIDACTAFTEEFTKQDILVTVRRGGPRQKEGLHNLKEFLGVHQIKHSVAGPERSFADVAKEIKHYVLDI